MDAVHGIEELARLLGSAKKICLGPSRCVTLYNPRMELVWDSNGRLTEIRVTGATAGGDTKTYRRTLVWSSEGYLQSVSQWEEVG